MLILIVEFFLFLCFGYTCHYAVIYFTFNDKVSLTYFEKFVGQLRYLTMINAYLLTLFLFVNVCLSFVKSSVAHRIRSDALTMMLTVGWFVSALFWSLYIYDRELVLPSILDEFIPVWWNYAAHAVNALAITADAFINRPMFLPTRLSLYMTLSLVAIYISILEYNIRVNDLYIYPIFKMLPTTARYLFNAGLTVSLLSLLLLAQKLVARLALQQPKPLANNNRPKKTKSPKTAANAAIRRKVRKD